MAHIIAIHAAESAKLAAVKAQMAELGSPTIRVVPYGDNQYLALEGSHRLAAAAELGLPVELDVVDIDADDTRRMSEMGLGLDSDNTFDELCNVDSSNPVYDLDIA